MTKRKTHFTLIELLLVIAIIVILLSILFPSLRKAKEKTYQIQCSGNLKQIGAAFLMYANDNNGFLPVPHTDGVEFTTPDTYYLCLRDYLGIKRNSWWQKALTNDVYICPRDNGIPHISGNQMYLSYAMNRYLGHRNLFKQNPAMLILADAYSWRVQALGEYVDKRHALGANSLFCDGTVTWRKAFTHLAFPQDR